MVNRPFWLERIRLIWKKTPIVWLTGVRRSGKTTLCKAITGAKYLNCDLPSTEALLADSEAFFASVKEPILILDEIHQLSDPSRVLKIGSDAFPHLKILATGSSTLAATQKFKDSLTGRKRTLTLPPVLFRELEAFGIADLKERLFRGGLPPALLAAGPDDGFYAEWMDSYFARDVQELFRVEKRAGFLRLLATVLRQSGGLMETTSLAKACGLSRPTILNYLEVFQTTHVAHVLRHFHGGGKQEILRQPKVYGFDTGFVRYAKGWSDLRNEDCGPLWEHLVLDTLFAIPAKAVHFWRDKRQHELDFVLPSGREGCHAVECKWSFSGLETKHFLAFRGHHPRGKNIVVTPFQKEVMHRKAEGLEFSVTGLENLQEILGL